MEKFNCKYSSVKSNVVSSVVSMHPVIYPQVRNKFQASHFLGVEWKQKKLKHWSLLPHTINIHNHIKQLLGSIYNWCSLHRLECSDLERMVTKYDGACMLQVVSVTASFGSPWIPINQDNFMTFYSWLEIIPREMPVGLFHLFLNRNSDQTHTSAPFFQQNKMMWYAQDGNPSLWSDWFSLSAHFCNVGEKTS